MRNGILSRNANIALYHLDVMIVEPAVTELFWEKQSGIRVHSAWDWP